jgi:hypothetical protein
VLDFDSAAAAFAGHEVIEPNPEPAATEVSSGIADQRRVKNVTDFGIFIGSKKHRRLVHVSDFLGPQTKHPLSSTKRSRSRPWC